mgnify:CR=1 FL=1
MAGQATTASIHEESGHGVAVFVVAVSLALTTLGLVMLFSAGVTRGAHALLSKQAIWLGLAVVMGTAASTLSLEWLRGKAWLLYFGCLLALALVLVPGLGVKVNGAQRWLGLGPLRVQPSEFAKVGLVLVMAAYLSNNQREIRSHLKGFLIPCCIIGAMLVLIMLEPDFGTTFLCGAVGATMMFQAGVNLRWLLPIATLAVAGFSVLVYFDPERLSRVTSFLDVEANAKDSAYQLWQGLLAFGVGGMEGVGLGKGKQQLFYLPEAHTDFIFSVIGEELGLFFTLGVVACFLGLFGVVAWRLREAPTLYGFLLAMGALLFVTLQAIINVGVVTGSMPTKGMSLPFISYGGSNLVVTFVMIGLVLNVLRSRSRSAITRSREL